MKILLLAIGRKHDAELVAAIEAYCRRITHYTTVSWQLIEPVKGKLDQLSTRRIESQALMAELHADDYIVVLDERGIQISSRELAKRIDERQAQATQRMVFVIGGSFGVDESLRQRAQFVWSLSTLTFPHQLVRLLLTEQLYRAYTIIRGEQYHHG